MPALQLRNVRKTYQSGDSEIVALDHATLDVGDDEILALRHRPVGPPEQLTRCRSPWLLSPSEGAVIVGEHDITEYSAKELTKFRREQVGSCSRP